MAERRAAPSSAIVVPGKKMIRTVVALLVAPIAGLLVGALAVNLAHPEGFGWLDGPISRPAASYFYAIMMGPLAIAGILLLGLPCSVLLSNKGIRSPLAYVGLGAVLGLLTPCIWMNIAYLIDQGGPTLLRFRLIPFGVLQPAIVGATMGLVFWAIAISRKKAPAGRAYRGPAGGPASAHP